MIPWFRILLLLVVAGLGVAGTISMSEALRDDSRKGWEAEAGQAAESLSGSLLGWLEESYGPLSGLAALLENSDNLTETEFLNAYDGLEARATAFFLDAAGLITPVLNTDPQEWHIKYSNDLDGVLSADEPLATHPEILEAVHVAEARFGEIILGRPVRLGDMSAVVAPVALGTFDMDGPKVVVGLVDFVDLTKGLFDLHVPEGVSMSIIGRFPKLDGPGAERVVIGKRSRRALHSVTTRTVSAGAELAITWDFDERYEGGPPHELADLALATGLAGVALITLIFGLLQQSRVRARTAEMATLRLESEMEQRALAEMEVRRMSKVFMDAADPIIIEDLDGIIIEMNAEAESAYGWPREELIGKPIDTILPAYLHDQAHELHARCKNDEDMRNIEGVRMTKTGRSIPVLITLSLLKDEEGRGEAVATLAKDISTQKQAELEVRRMSKVFMDAADPIIIEDLDGIIVEMNAEAENAYGWSREELIGHSITKIVPPERHDQAQDILGRCLTGEEVRNIEGIRWNKSGERLDVLLTLSRLTDESGEPLAVATLAKDISDLKIAEQKLQRHSQELEQRVSERTKELSAAKDQAEEATRASLNMMLDLEQERSLAEQMRETAEEATKAKSSFLAAMSHEIRTPMNGVVGMIDLLRQTKMDRDQSQMMRTVRDSAFSLLQIINDILDFSKIEAGKMDIESIPVSVRDAVEGVCETLAPNAAEKDLMVLTFVDPNIPEWVIGDQVRLRQILFNIGGNAIKFTQNEPGKQGKVMIRAELASDGNAERTVVRYSVSDNGIGIPEEAQEKLFEAFTQAESSTTRRFGGTGLGLSICVRLADLMEGEITVDSEPGEGSTFTVTIPHHRSDKASTLSDGKDLSGVRILLATAIEESADFLSRYVGHWGGEIEAVPDLGAVQSVAQKAASAGRRFDAIALDADWTPVEKKDLRQQLRDDAGLAGSKYIFLEKGRRKSARQADEDTVTVDAAPTHRAAFLSAVAVTVGRASPEIKAEEVTVDIRGGKAPSIDEAARMGQLILVAEDNLTNQDVIRRQLNLLGYAAELFEDGEKALEAWKKKKYAILLSDCHMPNMDGFGLTAAIREATDVTDARFPIVAITANALQGEADRCLAAGMDDYLSKPLEMSQLKATLKKWMPVSAMAIEPEPEEVDTPPAKADLSVAEEVVAEPAAAASDSSAIDPSALKSVFGDDEETFKEILRDFVDPAASNIEEIDAAFASRSADGVAKAAHKLKSSSRSVGANDLADLCLALETAGKAEDWNTIDEAAPHLAGVMQDVADYIMAL